MWLYWCAGYVPSSVEVDVDSTGVGSGVLGNGTYTDDGFRYTEPFTCVVSRAANYSLAYLLQEADPHSPSSSNLNADRVRVIWDVVGCIIADLVTLMLIIIPWACLALAPVRP